MEDDVQCPCCKLFCEPLTPPDSPHVRDRSPLHPALGVCGDCMHHLGDGYAVKRARAKHHFQMLRRDYRAARELVARARADVIEMQRELATRPVKTYIRVENLDRMVVRQAEQDRDEAYRRRDVAMGALSDVRRIHHQDPKNKSMCVCRNVYKKCDMAQIADRWDGVLHWEQAQARNAYRGERHYLEYDHPALSDRNYLRNVYGS